MTTGTRARREYQICVNCVMDTTDSLIQFDEKGFCDHCNNYYENILPNWYPDETGARELQQIAARIKVEGTNRDFDCLIGLSGGVDSSYLLHLAVKKLGLRSHSGVSRSWGSRYDRVPGRATFRHSDRIIC
ncbi:MAG: hypothetical protein ACOX5M_05160 [Bacillota bacterium]